MLLAGHLDHAAALPLEEPQERVRAPLPRGGPADADPVEDQRQARPGAAPGVGAEHGVGADDVKVSGERREHGALRVLFDAEDVDEERGALEALGRQGAEDGACFSEVVLVLRLLRASAATPRPREKAPSREEERKLLLRFFSPSLSLFAPSSLTCGQDRRRQHHHVGVPLAEIVGVLEELDADRLGLAAVVRAARRGD